MPMQANEIKDLILETFPDAKIKIDDLRGDGDHYAAYIETSSFKGLSKVKQHQMAVSYTHLTLPTKRIV